MINFGWLCVLIIALIAGWWLGFRTRPEEDEDTPKKNKLPREYLVGLNYLLNEEPDKAVDVFVKMLEIDSDIVETHLTVAKLFRRKGEVERAIRIHQNLIARPQIEKICRDQALFELGQDYLSAGMLDRAERIFLEVVEIKEYAIAALKALIDIYQQEKSWEKAIQIAYKLETASKKNMRHAIAHYYCELAEAEYKLGHKDKSHAYLDKAVHVDPNCVRASLLTAKYAMHFGEHKTALKNLKKIKIQNSDFLSEAIDTLANCYSAMKEEEKLFSYLMELVEEFPRVPVVLILSERIRQWKGDKVASDFVADYVKRFPTLNGLNLFINLYIASTEGKIREDLLIIQGLMKKILADKPEYLCTSCGFPGKNLHWLCPGCKQWNTIKPIHALEH